MSSKLHVMLLGVLGLASCVTLSTNDPHAVAPDYDRWEARISGDRAKLFQVAMTTLADSGYTVRSADRENGLIATNLRRVSWASSLGDYRLDLMVLPTTTDSIRLIVRGELCWVYDGALTCYVRRAPSDDWQIVKNIGEAIVARGTTR